MTKRWCPLAHTDCEDGYVKESEYVCIFWDSINQECTQAKSVLLVADNQRLMGQLAQAKIATEEDFRERIKGTREEPE